MIFFPKHIDSVYTILGNLALHQFFVLEILWNMKCCWSINERHLLAREKERKNLATGSSSEVVHGSEKWPELKWQKVEEKKKTEEKEAKFTVETRSPPASFSSTLPLTHLRFLIHMQPMQPGKKGHKITSHCCRRLHIMAVCKTMKHFFFLLA